MLNVPITGSQLGDWGLLILVLIAGLLIAVKKGAWWGWLIMAFAIFWAYRMYQVFYAAHGGRPPPGLVPGS